MDLRKNIPIAPKLPSLSSFLPHTILPHLSSGISDALEYQSSSYILKPSSIPRKRSLSKHHLSILLPPNPIQHKAKRFKPFDPDFSDITIVDHPSPDYFPQGHTNPRLFSASSSHVPTLPRLIDSLPSSSQLTAVNSTPLSLDKHYDFNYSCLDLHFSIHEHFLSLLDSQHALYSIFNYLPNHSLLNKRMRPILIDWLTEVAADYRLHINTLHLGIYLFDNFMSKTSNVPPNKLQCYGAACLYTAIKMEETKSIKLREMTSIAQGAFSLNELRDAEIQVLNAAGWNLNISTISMFLGNFCTSLIPSNALHTSSLPNTSFDSFIFGIASDFAGIVLHCTDCLDFSYSQIAASCYYLASLISQKKSYDFLYTQNHFDSKPSRSITNRQHLPPDFTFSELTECIDTVYQIISKIFSIFRNHPYSQPTTNYQNFCCFDPSSLDSNTLCSLALDYEQFKYKKQISSNLPQSDGWSYQPYYPTLLNNIQTCFKEGLLK
ncbi:hypothetical protein BB558_000127 [Smittium angustum]|uniref:Cyclin-like domain-containing protein n=1 Tax=Smittium angustum TaxID=133377 RepID=A0A2U1JF33_SMIAN|nr:hypothetical protein BB558_000127 [Smittium angustum]